MGAVLLAGDGAADMLAAVRGIVAPGDLAGDRTRRVYAAMLALTDRGAPIDAVTVSAEAGEPVSADYVSELVDGLARPAHALTYAAMVRDAARIREMARLGQRLTAAALAGEDTAELLAAIAAAATNGAGASVTVRTLANIYAEPGALDPPPIVVPRLAWAGRVSLLAAREKGGKSTMLTAAAAAVSRGARWLGDATAPGAVLWIGLEEHVADLAGRMSHHNADPDHIHVVDSLTTAADPRGAIAAIARELRPVLLVVDTLAALVERAAPDSGSAAAWTPIMSALARIARDTEAAVVLAHHARKSDGAYRDSSAIGAGVDAILEMAPGSDDGVRRLRVKARWRVPDYAVRLAGDSYELAAGEVSLDARVLAYITTHPGCSVRDVRGGTEGRAADIGAAVQRLLATGTVNDHPERRGSRLYAAGAGNRSAADAETPGTGPEPSGNQSEPLTGTGAVPESESLVLGAGTSHDDPAGRLPIDCAPDTADPWCDA